MTTYYVHSGATGNDDGTSWEDAFNDLHAAVTSRSGGDAIWVKTGTYYLSVPLSIPENVSVYGGFDLWLTGTDGSTSDRPWHTYLNGGDSVQGVLMQDGALIDGFVIEDCIATDGAGIGVIGGDEGYYYGPELITDGDMSAAGTAAWSESANATLSKETSGGIVGQYLSVTVDDGYPNSANAYQSVMTVGHKYDGTGYLKGEGGRAALYDGSVELVSTEGFWEFKGTGTFTATSTNFILKCTAIETDHSFFDEISLKEWIAYEGVISATIRNCWIRNCHADNDGGGILVSNGATVVIDECTIHNCTADGDGGGIAFTDECTAISVTGEIYSCTAGDYGGGISVRGNDADNDYTFLNCRIHDNDAGLHGGGVYVADNAGADMRITRCVIADNAATSGDLYLVTGVVTVTGSTLNNEDVYAIQRVGGTMTVVNSIVWGSATPTNGTMTITYSDVQGGYAGTGNVNDDPLFVGTGFHPYAIGAVSDAVDAANSGATYYTSTDILGASMYDHPGKANTGAGATAYVDMGAYEYQGSPGNAMDMAYYFVDFDLATADVSSNFWMHAILRLPEMPRVFSGNLSSAVNVRHRISSEIEIDEADSELAEYVYIDSGIAAFREYDGTPLAPFSPTRDVDYSEDFQSADDATVAEDWRHREGEASSKIYEPVGESIRAHFRHVVVSMEWTPIVNDQYDVMHIYNVDFQQIHNEAYGYSHAAVEAHADDTIFSPDVPLSSYHMRLLLQETLLKVLYEAVAKMSVPVFGQFDIPVV